MTPVLPAPVVQAPPFNTRRSQYDELFYRQEVLGEYLNIFAGACYHAFDDSTAETLHSAISCPQTSVPAPW
jgi:hypothetical protein